MDISTQGQTFIMDICTQGQIILRDKCTDRYNGYMHIMTDNNNG